MIGIEMTDGAERDQEDDGGNACDDDQSDVNGAVQALARAAVVASDEVLLIVLAHLRRDAGDVIPPTGKDISYYLIDTL